MSDKTKVSVWQVTFTLGTTVKIFDEGIDAFACIRSTIKLHSQKLRQKKNWFYNYIIYIQQQIKSSLEW